MFNRSISADDFLRFITEHNLPKIREVLDAQQCSDDVIKTTIRTTIEALDKLNLYNLQRLKQHIDEMLFQGTLTIATLQQAFARVSFKIGAVPESKLTKGIKRARERREHHLDNHLNFFLKPGASKQEDNYGGTSKISKGYASADAADPAYTVKRFCLDSHTYPRPARELAAHEIKYAKYLGRHAGRYQSKKGPVIVTDWQTGESLEQMEKNNFRFSDYSIARRLKWLASLNEDLDRLHSSGYLFGDLKPGNCILDLNTDTMRLIDFGSAQKVDSRKKYCATRGYIDTKEGSQGFPKKLASDMYAFGYIISCIFPELINDEMMAVCARVNMMGKEILIPIGAKHIAERRKDVTFTDTDMAILSLFDAVMETAQKDRCTSQQVKSFLQTFQGMLSTKNQIDHNELNNLLSSTINRNEFEVEDAFRGSRRPAKFGATAKKREAVNAPVETLFAQTKKNKMDELQSIYIEDPWNCKRSRF